MMRSNLFRLRWRIALLFITKTERRLLNNSVGNYAMDKRELGMTQYKEYGLLKNIEEVTSDLNDQYI